MYRSEKELRAAGEIDRILEESQVCRLALNGDGYPYIVPMNFGWGEIDGGGRVLFFHSSLKGKKIELLREDGRAAFEVDTDTELVPADEACSFTMKYRSVCGRGRVRFLESEGEKCFALNQIMKKYTSRADWEFPPAKLKAVAVFVLKIEEIHAKKS
jgi:uncharacterized protein